MKTIVQNITIFVKISLILICIGHIMVVVYSEFHPKLPNVEVIERNLSDIDFPLRKNDFKTITLFLK